MGEDKIHTKNTNKYLLLPSTNTISSGHQIFYVRRRDPFWRFQGLQFSDNHLGPKSTNDDLYLGGKPFLGWYTPCSSKHHCIQALHILRNAP